MIRLAQHKGYYMYASKHFISQPGFPDYGYFIWFERSKKTRKSTGYADKWDQTYKPQLSEDFWGMVKVFKEALLKADYDIITFSIDQHRSNKPDKRFKLYDRILQQLNYGYFAERKEEERRVIEYMYAKYAD